MPSRDGDGVVTHRTGQCARCTEVVEVDGVNAGVRTGRVLCDDCADAGVIYVAECLDCDWDYQCQDSEFNWYHAKQRVQQEGNNHENRMSTFEDESHETVWRRYDE